MKVIVCETYDDMSSAAAELIKNQLMGKPDSVLGFATGSTPIGTYRCLIGMYKNKEIDFGRASSFNLDEYYPIKNSDPQSYHYFMRENLFRHININPSQIHIPNGETGDPAAECERYETEIASRGPIDLQILGIGRNGHIGFNEPDRQLHTKTHITPLTEDTIDANSRFFASEDEVPDQALTMGISTILSSKKIILLASGHSKYEAVKELLSDKITTDNPSTLLKVHPDVTLICDRGAYSDMHIGIDLGGMSIKFGVVDNNKIIDRTSVSVNQSSSAEDIVGVITRVCSDFIDKYPIHSVGIGTPGFISGNKITAVNLPFKKFPLAAAISEKLNIPVSLDNDANCAALGESIAGAGTSASDILLLTLGTGIGAGIIIDNKIYSGKGSAGEAGHMCIDFGGIPCTCGSSGCWERYASVSALIAQTKKAAEENPDSILASLCDVGADGRTVFNAMERGCPTAKKVFEHYLNYLAAGIISLINLFSPELILISGGISNESERLLAPLSERLPKSVPVKIASLKNDAGIIGAAAL